MEDSASQQHSLKYMQEILGKTSTLEPKSYLEGNLSLENLVPATGVALCTSDGVYKKNATPDDATMHTLIEWLERGVEPLFSCDDLPSRFGETVGTYASGLLAAKVPGRKKTWLLWFRMEIIQEVSWAGDPYTPKEISEFGERLYPRTSFKIWKETRRGHSVAWLPSELQAAEQLANLTATLPGLAAVGS